MTTGERIRLLRLKRGMSQSELGAKIGVKTPAIYKYENGLVVNLKRSTIEKLADALETTPSYLMGFEEEEKPTPVSESGPSNPIIVHIMDIVCQLSPETQQKCLEYFESLLALQNSMQPPNSQD